MKALYLAVGLWAIGSWAAVFDLAVDGCSRLVYSELLGDERKEAAAHFWLRANKWFARHGITVRKVLTDNGSCYRSHAFRDALGYRARYGVPQRCPALEVRFSRRSAG